MTAIPMFAAESTLTDRYQTTVPEPVRLALKLSKRDKLRYELRPDGSVVMTRAERAGEEDPILEQFLEFMARDLTSHPERLRTIDPGLRDRIQALVGKVDVDLDAALSPDDE